MGTTRGVWTPSGDLSSHSFVDGKVPFHQPAVATNLFLLLSHLTSFLIPFCLSHYTQNKVQRIFKEIINQNNFIAGFYGKILCNSYQGQGLYLLHSVTSAWTKTFIRGLEVCCSVEKNAINRSKQWSIWSEAYSDKKTTPGRIRVRCTGLKTQKIVETQ